jgi:hypothetical protein
MFEVTNYAHPFIFVKCRRTAETYKFEIGDDGTLTHSEARFDQGDARRTAIAYLVHLKMAAVTQLTAASSAAR